MVSALQGLISMFLMVFWFFLAGKLWILNKQRGTYVKNWSQVEKNNFFLYLVLLARLLLSKNLKIIFLSNILQNLRTVNTLSNNKRCKVYNKLWWIACSDSNATKIHHQSNILLCNDIRHLETKYTNALTNLLCEVASNNWG